MLFKRIAIGLYTFRALELFRMYDIPARKVLLRVDGRGTVPAAETGMKIFCSEEPERVTL